MAAPRFRIQSVFLHSVSCLNKICPIGHIFLRNTSDAFSIHPTAPQDISKSVFNPAFGFYAFGKNMFDFAHLGYNVGAFD